MDPTDQEARLAAAEAVAAEALSRYRDLIAAAPDLIPDLVGGTTIEEIDASAEIARQAYANVSRRIAQSYERQIPPANPTRSSQIAGAETLKPEAKIALGLTNRR